jgi:hypothetical protein
MAGQFNLFANMMPREQLKFFFDMVKSSTAKK